MLSAENQPSEVEEEKKVSVPIKVSAALSRKPTKQPARAINAVSTVDEEDDASQKREMILLDYSEEELKSFVNDESNQAQTSNSTTKAKTALSNEALKKIAERIPSDK